MKTKLLLSALFTFYFYLLSSQVPQGFNYQAIARNELGKPIVDATIKVKLSILTDTTGFRSGSTGTYVWEEEHTGVVTNAYGLFTIIFGSTSATRVQGVASFSAINWNQPKLYLGTKIANPTEYVVLGGAVLWSVPYALISGNLSGPVKKLAIKSLNTSPDSAIFEVKNNIGQTIFAVYNEGVRIYVDDGAKGITKGGFAIGGFGTDKAGTSQNYFTVSRDSIRAYVNDTISKGITKGGFAIGGFGTEKAPKQEYFRVTRDSTRIYVNDLPGGKGITKGGFAIGGFDNVKTTPTQYLRVTSDSTRIVTADTIKGFGVGNLSSGNTLGYLRLTPSNYFIGHQAGKSITTGLYNSVMGYKSGFSLLNGTSNSFIGYKAGYSNTSGSYNVFIGNNAGYLNNGSMNTFIGYISGQNNTTGYYNSFLGDSTGFNNLSGSNNTFIGGRAGFSNKGGSSNTFTGSQTGYNNLGSYNTFTGYSAGLANTTGSFNVANGILALSQNTIGHGNVANGGNALLGNIGGSYNVANGTQAMMGNTTGSYNTANGVEALQGNKTGIYNVANGAFALCYNTAGNYNTASGSYALNHNKGYSNTAIGYSSLFNNTTGNRNTAIGDSAGYQNQTGSRNVFIGYMAGYNSTGSNQLYINNSILSPPLIWGDFSTKDVVVCDLWVTGHLWTKVDGDEQGWHYLDDDDGADDAQWYEFTRTPSDNRLKKETRPIENAIEKVGKLTGVTYYWNDDAISYFSNSVDHIYAGPQSTENETKSLREEKRQKLNDQFSGQQIGLVAQEVEKVIPEVVHNNKDGYKQIAYGNLVGLLVEAMKEQQQQIESTKQENQDLRSELNELKALVNTLIANQSTKGIK